TAASDRPTDLPMAEYDFRPSCCSSTMIALDFSSRLPRREPLPLGRNWSILHLRGVRLSPIYHRFYRFAYSCMRIQSNVDTVTSGFVSFGRIDARQHASHQSLTGCEGDHQAVVMNEGELFYTGEDNRPDVHGVRPGAEQGRASQEVKARPQPIPGEVDTIGASELSFSAEEYLGRIASVRNRMVDQGLAALIVTDPANTYYLTGYTAWSCYTSPLPL